VPKQAPFFLTVLAFIALAFFAWRSGRQVYETGPELSVFEAGDAVVFSWGHPVEAPMAERFARAFEEWKGRKQRIIIDLHSPGGEIAQGRLVIEEIERMKATHDVATRVRSGRTCASMCVPIFLAGERRIAAPDARFMFHEPAIYNALTEERVERPVFESRMTADRFFARYFESSPMDPEWRGKLETAWKGRDIWLTAEELVEQQSGVVSELE
jgi:ATP-dependent protease ClpP protease subunit